MSAPSRREDSPSRRMSALLVATARSYSSGDDDDDEDQDHDHAIPHDHGDGTQPPDQHSSTRQQQHQRQRQRERDDVDSSAEDSGRRAAVDAEEDASMSDASALDTASDTHGSETPAAERAASPMLSTASASPYPSPTNRSRADREADAATAKAPASIDDMPLSLHALQSVVAEKALDASSPALLDGWREREEDGRLVAPDGRVIKSLRDALRVVVHTATGRIPRDDMYFLAILRRQLAELAMPFRDGPITVTAFGRVCPKEMFYSPKKLFPVRESAVATASMGGFV
ncbi:hypothetical protein PINS_up011799 [Pythium insidiosum]|nr:hypothetical protein PINS_up011799 [Pythium insidiosum]